MSAIKLRDFFKNYKGEPHQAAAVDLLQQMMPESLLRNDAEWVECYRYAPKPKPPAPPAELTWLQVMEMAKRAGARYPELVAAQWALESDWGRSTSGRYNYLGLKGPGSAVQTQEYVNGKPITITAEFLDFKDPEECITYLVDRWHRDWKTYKGCNNAPNRDDAARWLQREGYATDPGYPEKLIRLMNQQAPVPKPQAPVLQQGSHLTPRSPFSAKLTPNIRLGEFALDKPERRFDHQHQVDTAVELANFLERVRRNFMGLPVIITSGYRPKAVNDAVGGATNSEHLFACPKEGAVDFYLDGANINDVQAFCDKYWPYSVGYGAPKGFVHLGRRADASRRRWDY